MLNHTDESVVMAAARCAHWPGSALLMLLCCGVRVELLHVLQVDENEEVSTGYQTPTSPPKSELALQKGFRRRTWTGPAWLDNVTSTGHVSRPILPLLLLLLAFARHVYRAFQHRPDACNDSLCIQADLF